MAIWNRLTAFVTGGAVGSAARSAVEPALTPLAQTAWRNEPHKVLDPELAAEADAKDLATAYTIASLGEDGAVQESAKVPGSPVDFQDDAARSGVGSHRYIAERELKHGALPFSEALTLWRRGRSPRKRSTTCSRVKVSARRSGLR